MALLNLDTASLPLYTSSTISATGATTLVAAPGAGQRLAVHMLRVVLMTTTAGQVQSEFNASMFWNAGFSVGTLPLDRDLQASPWALDTDTALTFACTVSAASTPSLRVEVLFQRVLR